MGGLPTYDSNGNVASITDHAQGSTYNRTMTYDGLDRLKTATSAAFGGDGVHRFGYDAVDNLKFWTLGGVKDYAEYIYDPTTWQLTNIRNTAGATVVGLGYDQQGNLANKNGQIHNFDYGNRLRTALGTESYRYDAHGRRILTQSPNGKSFAQYGVDGALLWERDERVSARLEYVYLGGSLLATRRRPIGSTSETIYYYHTDALGSQVAMTDAVGAVAQRSEYDPFGALANRVANNRPGYTGHVMDAPTGLTYMQQRYYDPGIGRFLSVDPVTANSGTGANFNRYWYANNNPYKFTDPDGRLPVFVVPAIIFGVGALLNSGDAHAPAPGEQTRSMPAGEQIISAVPGGRLLAPVKMAANAGRNANKLKPDPKATGPHSTIKRDAQGRTTNTATYAENPRNPSGFQETKRVDITGKAHTNPDGTVVPTPHVKEAGVKEVRPALPEDLPRKK